MPSGKTSWITYTLGEWRLVFTTGTKERQQKSGGRVNYFPLKGDTEVRRHHFSHGHRERNIRSVGHTSGAIRGGTSITTRRRRKLEFEFDTIEVLGLLKIKLGRKDIAKNWVVLVARTTRSSRNRGGGRSSIGRSSIG
jgi:hypothetical protein